MKLNKQPVWVVRDPSPISELGDIFYQTTYAKLPLLIIGAGVHRWFDEHSTLYDNEEEALADAQARYKALEK